MKFLLESEYQRVSTNIKGLNIKGSVQSDSLSWRYDLAELNPKCHINYSIIFTEISFFSETLSIMVVGLSFIGVFMASNDFLSDK